MNKQNQHILVTGVPRSGTTFLGTILSLPKEVGYIREPFNRDFGLTGLEYQFPYLYSGMKDENMYRSMVEALFARRAEFKPLPITSANNIKQAAGRLLFKSGSNFSYVKSIANPMVQRYLLKDPMISLGSEYLHREYNMQVVVIIRKSLPNIASMRRVGVYHTIEGLLEQNPLYEEFLKPYVSPYIGKQLEPLEQQALLWTAINAVLLEYIQRNPRFIVVFHHDLARKPVSVTKKIYQALGLDFTPAIARKIKDYTSRENDAAVDSSRMHVLKRNSSAIADVKKGVFTEEEEATIANITQPLENKLMSSV